MAAHRMCVFALVAALASPVALGAGKPEREPFSFDFRAVAVGQVIQLVYSEALRVPYVIDADVLADSRVVAFRYSAADGDMRAFVRSFLDALGLVAEVRGGVHFVRRRPEAKEVVAEPDVFVYKPRYRDVGYLSRVLASVVRGNFAANRAVALPVGDRVDKPVPDGSAAALVDQSADVLVYAGTAKEIELLKALLPQVDTAVGQVMVRGVVYEVSDVGASGSAVSLALNLLGGRVSLGGGGSAGAALDTVVQLKGGSIDAVFSALASDSRFRVVSKPSLRVRSGGLGRFTVGADVPVLGAVSYPGNGGGPVQSVDYRSSGVIFQLEPEIRDSVVDLTVSQQLSDFVKTTTGVNGSPTLTKRELKTVLSVTDGDVVVLGGLAEDKESFTRSGVSFLPTWMRSKSTDSSRSEILLILEVKRI